jgi:inorganic pyrophosphatase
MAMKDPASDLSGLAPYGEDGILRMVVETPRGAGIKLAYEPGLDRFVAKHSLALGITYPFDWGFIPGTLAADGDPLDALAVHDGGTYPGVILPCRPLGVVDVAQKGKHGREDNPRLVVIPTWHDRPEGQRLAATVEGGNRAVLLERDVLYRQGRAHRGMAGARAASKLIERTRRG